MKAAKAVLMVLAAAAVILALFLMGGLFQRLLVAGARLADDVGDTVIITDDDVVGERAPVYETPLPAATWPAGDDPSWSEDMPLAPVDQTAEELAREMEGQ